MPASFEIVNWSSYCFLWTFPVNIFLNIMQYIEMNISNRNYDYASYQFQNL
jgi:hypothetical protein